MKIKKLPVVSDRIILADLSPAFKTLEGEVEPQDRAWVIVRQATQEDAQRRADLYAKRETRYESDQGTDRIAAISEVYQDNPLRRMMLEAYWTLQETGNLTTEDEKPYFHTLPAKKMPQAEFEALWGGLDPVVARAIYLAVLQANPDWRSRGE